MREESIEEVEEGKCFSAGTRRKYSGSRVVSERMEVGEMSMARGLGEKSPREWKLASLEPRIICGFAITRDSGRRREASWYCCTCDDWCGCDGVCACDGDCGCDDHSWDDD